MNIISISSGEKLATFTLALIVLLLPFDARSGALDDSRACFTEGPGGDLEDGQQGVLSRLGLLDYEGRQHKFEALSLWGFEGAKADKTCLRYELKNLSGKKLEAVSWAVAGIEFVPIAQGGRAKRTVPAIPPYPAGADLTKVTAFKNSSDYVRAYVPLTRTAGSAAGGRGFAEFDIRDSMPDAVKALDQASLPTRRIATVSREALPDQGT